MKIADLRQTLKTCNDRFIGIRGEHIYYAVERAMDGQPHLLLMDCNWAERQTRTLADYCINRQDYVLHCFLFAENILLIMENGGSEAWLLKLSRYSGEQQSLRQARFAGSFVKCSALDSDHVIFYSRASRMDASLFREYSRRTGYMQAACLYDMKQDCCWSIQDARICAGAELLTFSGGGEQKLLLTQTGGTEAEKRRDYRNRRFVRSRQEDSISVCSLAEFIAEIEQETARIPMQRLFRAGISGMVRYVCMDSESLYFRALDFPSNEQHVFAVSRHTGAVRDAAALTLLPEEPDARFTAEHGRFFRLTERADGQIDVQGFLNSTAQISYDAEFGEMVSCLDDRYLVLRDILKDDTDTLIFSSVCDTKTGQVRQFEGNCAVQENVILLY